MATASPAPSAPRPAGAQLLADEPAAGPGLIGRAPTPGAHFFAANSAALFMSASSAVAETEPAAAVPAPPRAPGAAATALLNGATSPRPAVAAIAVSSPDAPANPGPGLAGSAAARALSSLVGASVRAARPEVETARVVTAPTPPLVAPTDNTRSPDAEAPPGPQVAAANPRESDILPAKKKGLFRRR
jgi:hypothetical protein